jgi:hypothetical protein
MGNLAYFDGKEIRKEVDVKRERGLPFRIRKTTFSQVDKVEGK